MAGNCVIGGFMRPVRFKKQSNVSDDAWLRWIDSVCKLLTGRSWAMLKWPIQSNGFGHEKNDVGDHVLGIGGV